LPQITQLLAPNQLGLVRELGIGTEIHAQELATHAGVEAARGRIDILRFHAQLADAVGTAPVFDVMPQPRPDSLTSEIRGHPQIPNKGQVRAPF